MTNNVFAAFIVCAAIQSSPSLIWEIAGTVTDTRGPVKGAFVILSGPVQILPIKTGPNGEFRFRGEVEGTYSLRVQKKDDTGEPRSRTLRLVPGKRVEQIDIKIPAAAVISGRVLDDDKRPAPRLVVLALRKVFRDGMMRLEMKGGDRTNDKGEYRISALPEGTYLVAVLPSRSSVRKIASQSVAHTGEQAFGSAIPPMTFAPQGRIVESASQYRLRAGEDLQAVDVLVRKEPTFCISFQPTGSMADSRFPASAAYATVMEWVGNEVQVIAEGPVDSGQTYEVCGLAPAEYRIHLHSFSADRRSGIGYARSSAHLSRRHLALGAIVLNGTLPLNGSLRIKESKPEDSLPPDLRLNLTPRERGLLIADVRQVAFTPQGDIKSDGVYVDSYRISLAGLPAGAFVYSADQGGSDALSNGVSPGRGALTITLSANGSVLVGLVTDGRDHPLSDATVFLVSKVSNRILIAESDQTGLYRFENNLPPGDYAIVAIAGLSESQRTDPAVATSFASSASNIHLSERESKTLNLRAQAVN